MQKIKISTLFTYILILVCSFKTIAQNLVSNYSFEDTTNCPFSTGQINKSVGWSSYRNTPDFFNACASSQFVGVPENYFDYQNARTGVAYGGFLAFSTNGTNAREVLGTQLNQVLTVGTKYYIKFFVSRASRSVPGLRADVSVDKLGVRFSTIPFANGSPLPINNVSQVFSSVIITDTLNWTEIAGSFVADSNYQYIAISNFFEDQFVNYIQPDTINYLSYYFVDDICVSSDSMYCDQLLSIKENNDNEPIQIYPNPARDWIVIRGNGIKSLKIYDVSGKVCYLKNLSIDSYKLDISNYATGLYFVKTETSGGVHHEKLLINH